MKSIFLTCIRGLITHLPLTLSLRDLLAWPLASRLLGTSYDEIQPLKAGFSIHAYMEDQLGRFALFYGHREKYFWEPTTMQLLERLVAPADEVIIAGSHIGLTALYARHAMKKPGSRVHTFEPIDHLYAISKKNFDLNTQLGEIVLTRAALGDTPGTVSMTQDRIRSRIIESITADTTQMTESVPVTTISAYAKQHNIQKIDLILLDVEGYEQNALTGMEDILTSNPPTDIIYEISFPKKDSLEMAHRIDAYLSQFGYTTYIICEAHDVALPQIKDPTQQLIRTTPEVYEAHKNDRYFNVYATLTK